MFPSVMSNSNSVSEEASCVSSTTRVQEFGSCLNPMLISTLDSFHHHQPDKIKKKRNLPGNPDPEAEVIALSPKSLMATNRFVCEICKKGFQRDQNLQLHRRGHNLPWKLKKRNSKENFIIRKRVYVCPEVTCVHHHPSRALGDLTGIKKHFCRKHGEKKWKCEKCAKIYAVQSDWKAHSKTCGTREYKCDCGTLFSRKDSFITHRAFCDALAQESAGHTLSSSTRQPFYLNPISQIWDPPQNPKPNPIYTNTNISWPMYDYQEPPPPPPPFHSIHTSAQLSATALLQKAATCGAQTVGHVPSALAGLEGHGISPEYLGFVTGDVATWQGRDHFTRDFLGLTGHQHRSGGGTNVHVNASANMRNLLSFTGGLKYPATTYESDQSALKPQDIGFAESGPGPGPAASKTWGNCSLSSHSIL
ncbi:hypothetical protein LguiB_000290 [Lonicera macranthoides]